MRISNEINIQIPSLIELSINSLTNLFDVNQGLFTKYIKNEKIIPMPLSWSICYTAITILGVNKARNNGWLAASFIDQIKVIDTLVSNWKYAKEFGHLGLIQWANAECKGIYSPEITTEIERRSSVDYLERLPTTELAWLLTGLCATYQMFSRKDKINELAALYYKIISNNFFAQTGLFCHTHRKVGHFDLRSQIGNFADQIYAIFALSLYYEVFKENRALEQALRCADQLCLFQGIYGQWWWHYLSNQGIVVSRYPVFSVHQDGMGPMGLQKLAEVSGKDYKTSIIRGLNWLFKSNELGLEMVDRENYVIWRDIERISPISKTRYISMLMAKTGLIKPIRWLESPYCLKINREMRPYEIGWLLYALPDFLAD